MSAPAARNMTPRTAEILAKIDPGEVHELLLELGADAALKAFDLDRRRQYAAELLRQGCTRYIARKKLMQQYRISRASAYRDIDAAFQQNCLNTLQTMRRAEHILEP